MRSQNFVSRWRRKGTWLDEVLLDQLLTRFVYYSASGEKERIAFTVENERDERTYTHYDHLWSTSGCSNAPLSPSLFKIATGVAYWGATAYEKIRTCQFQTSTLIPDRPDNMLDLTIATSGYCSPPYQILIIYLGICLKIRHGLINHFLDDPWQLTGII